MTILRLFCLAAAICLPMSALADGSRSDADAEQTFYLAAKAALDESLVAAPRDHADDTWMYQAAVKKAVRDYDLGRVETFAQR